MLRFVIEFVVFFAILMLSTFPLRRVARIVKRGYNHKKWIRAAAVVSLAAAGLGWSSRDLQQGCLAERNEGCIDVGGAGTQFLLVGGFVIFALISAYMVYND